LRSRREYALDMGRKRGYGGKFGPMSGFIPERVGIDR
jgi:hypothetical protein